MKIFTVVGARPQFIKAAVISRTIQDYKLDGKYPIDEVLVHTGQHYDSNMSQVFFDEMHIPEPNYNLDINGNSHGAMTGRMLEKLEALMIKEQPNLVLVYGDTNSTLAGALAAVKLDIHVAHVEAGLRSYNMSMPEEINRILTDRIANVLFCPTQTAVNNLLAEGFTNWAETTLYNVGDVMYDAALYYRKIAVPSPAIKKILELNQNEFYLATIHRQENTDHPARLKELIEALDDIASRIPIILPLHPRTYKKITEIGIRTQNLFFIEPVGYFDMLCLLNKCKAVFTDSGGVQKEAYYFQKPCITVREETEWIELVEKNYNVLVGAHRELILKAEQEFVPIKRDYSESLYGDGTAGKKIVDHLIEAFKNCFE